MLLKSDQHYSLVKIVQFQHVRTQMQRLMQFYHANTLKKLLSGTHKWKDAPSPNLISEFKISKIYLCLEISNQKFIFKRNISSVLMLLTLIPICKSTTKTIMFRSFPRMVNLPIFIKTFHQSFNYI